jgi:hypothetical protein
MNLKFKSFRPGTFGQRFHPPVKQETSSIKYHLSYLLREGLSGYVMTNQFSYSLFIQLFSIQE